MIRQAGNGRVVYYELDSVYGVRHCSVLQAMALAVALAAICDLSIFLHSTTPSCWMLLPLARPSKAHASLAFKHRVVGEKSPGHLEQEPDGARHIWEARWAWALHSHTMSAGCSQDLAASAMGFLQAFSSAYSA